MVTRRRWRALGRIVAVAVCGYTASLVLLLRIFRRNRELLLSHGMFRGLLKGYNRMTRNLGYTVVVVGSASSCGA
ncbi:hypothetical protein MB901379_03040 [Mycobacterium basiliense]|uniref:Uncharacterized protein n=1 Tax=Mycobacterium basiliense TaxID=2094119 RepID=A0A3S4BJA3_9MYCO|nr:hypothetical protein [Mycobacterium basiliense]VDM89463.1 hypothetical protein MB901379_03040 [Mycobacterium basiliense]